jgi:hypothetical protein
MKRWGAVVFWVGVVVLVVGVAAAVWGGTRAITSVTSAVESASSMPGGRGSIELESTEEATVYQKTSSVDPTAVCQVVGPAGNRLALTRSTETRGSLGDSSYVNVGSFEARQAGTYRVTCTGGETVLGPSLDFGALGGGTVGIVLGLLAAAGGFVFVIVGAVLWFVGRSRAAGATGSGAPPAGGPGYPTSSAPPPPPPSS